MNRGVRARGVAELVEQDRLVPSFGELGEVVLHFAPALGELLCACAIFVREREERVQADHVEVAQDDGVFDVVPIAGVRQ